MKSIAIFETQIPSGNLSDTTTLYTLLHSLNQVPDHPLVMEKIQKMIRDKEQAPILLMLACHEGLPTACRVLIEMGAPTDVALCGTLYEGDEALNFALKKCADVTASHSSRHGAHHCAMIILSKHKSALGSTAFSAKHASDLWLWSHGRNIQLGGNAQLGEQYDRSCAVRLLLSAGVDPNVPAELFGGITLPGQPVHFFYPLYL